MPHLANRLAVHALTDLNNHCPRTILAIENWLDHIADWLAELAACTTNKNQVPHLISVLAINLAGTLGCSMQEARTIIKDEMVIKQAERTLA